MMIGKLTKELSLIMSIRLVQALYDENSIEQLKLGKNQE